MYMYYTGSPEYIMHRQTILVCLFARWATVEQARGSRRPAHGARNAPRPRPPATGGPGGACDGFLEDSLQAASRVGPAPDIHVYQVHVFKASVKLFKFGVVPAPCTLLFLVGPKKDPLKRRWPIVCVPAIDTCSWQYRGWGGVKLQSIVQGRLTQKSKEI